MTALTVPIGCDSLGLPVPSVLHAITSSLPTWSDNAGYSAGQAAVHDALLTGYPRLEIHKSIQKLSDICRAQYGLPGEMCLLFPTRQTAGYTELFTRAIAHKRGFSTDIRIVCCPIRPVGAPEPEEITGCPVESQSKSQQYAEVFAAFFHADNYQFGRRIGWQDCGLGISSRFAEHCLSILGVPGYPRKHISDFLNAYGRTVSKTAATGPAPRIPSNSHAPLVVGAEAKAVLRRRIAGYLAGNEFTTAGQTLISRDDVFLYPCGMSAIWNTQQLLLRSRPAEKSVVFGFPFQATLKIIELSEPGVVFYGNGRDSDIDDLESLLARKVAENPSVPPLLVLYTETPSNPCLRTANMPRLRALADKYDFIIVVDDTIGSFANVDILPYADIVISSLTKYMSGYANALGGSITINPRMKHHAYLKKHLESTYEDTYFDQDAIVMEQNSRDYFERIRIINANAEHVCDFLHKHSIDGGASERDGAIIKRVHYPKYVTPDNYERCRRRSADGEFVGGYGGLLSLTFTTLEASRAFFDALQVAKGPTFGTTFTLACPYSILAHHTELEWAAACGVEEGLVRIGVGTEDKEVLLRTVDDALRAARSA